MNRQTENWAQRNWRRATEIWRLLLLIVWSYVVLGVIGWGRQLDSLGYRRLQFFVWNENLDLRVSSKISAAVAIAAWGSFIAWWVWGRSENQIDSSDEFMLSVGDTVQVVHLWYGVITVVVVAHLLAAPFMIIWSAIVGRVFTPLVGRHTIVHRGVRPRLIPAITGVFERVLFTLFAVLLLSPSVDEVGALIAIVGGYIALRTIRRELGDSGTDRPASLHAIWNIAVNLAFPITAGWLFWRVPLGQP